MVDNYLVKIRCAAWPHVTCSFTGKCAAWVPQPGHLCLRIFRSGSSRSSVDPGLDWTRITLYAFCAMVHARRGQRHICRK